MTGMTELPVREEAGWMSRALGVCVAAGLVLLALVEILHGVFPPPALAAQEAAVGARSVDGAGPAAGALGAGGSGTMPGVARSTAPLPATAAEAARAQEAAAAAAARAVGPQVPGQAPGQTPGPASGAASGAANGPANEAANGRASGGALGQANGHAGGQASGSASGPAGAATPALTVRPDYVSELEWQALQGVAAQSRDPARTLATLVAKLRFSKQLELFRRGTAGVPRAALAAQLLADLPAQVAAGSLARDQALRLLPTLIEPLAPDPAARAARLQQERARLPGQALQPVP